MFSFAKKKALMITPLSYRIKICVFKIMHYVVFIFVLCLSKLFAMRMKLSYAFKHVGKKLFYWCSTLFPSPKKNKIINRL